MFVCAAKFERRQKGRLCVETWTSNAIDWKSLSNSIFEINLTLLYYEILDKLVTYIHQGITNSFSITLFG